MKRAILPSLLSACLLIAATTTAVAQQTSTTDVPRTISYQGLLTSGDGTPLPSGAYDITVTLYADEAGSQAIWQNTYHTSVINGVFNLFLGNGSAPLPAPNQMNRPLWVGTAVNGSGQMAPLTPLTSSPYALNLPDQAVTTQKLADGAVTEEKVDMPYIAGVRVNGAEISSKGAVLDIRSGKDIDVRYDDVSESVVIEAKSATGTTDGEKGTKVQDVTYLVSLNWLGRDIGPNQPFYAVPNMLTSTYNTLGGGRTNNIQDNADYSTITGGQDNIIRDGSDYDFIGGGQVNTINDNSNYNCITCGLNNVIGISSHYNAIDGGQDNTIGDNDNHNFIGGGFSNLIADQSSLNVIAGGNDNTVNTVGNFNAIGGGNTNIINPGDGNTISGGVNNVTGPAAGATNYATIGGGQNNNVAGPMSFIGGGQSNAIGAFPISTIGGGGNNTINAPEGTIGGGHFNAVNAYVGAITGGHNNMIGINGNAGAIIGGRQNTVDAITSAIGGGQSNNILNNSALSFIGGGETNTIGAAGAVLDHAAIGGGQNNTITGAHSFIGGGLANIVGGPQSVVGGGQNNVANGGNAIIGGGQNNTVAGFHSTIGGGLFNAINGSPMATIGGGANNTVNAPEGTIAGGHINLVESYVSTIAGGHNNWVAPTSEAGSIGGGRNNTVNARLGTIPGGDHLITSLSYAQSAMGFGNNPWGLPAGPVPFRPLPGQLTNEPLFMVGNGDLSGLPIIVQSNAFEVSYNGHSVVYDVNGSGGAFGPGPFRSAVKGGTYTDNVIYGWGEVNANGTLACADFGTASIQHPAIGVYRVTLNITAPDGLTALNINCGAAVATLGTGTDPTTALPMAPPVGTKCAYIYTTRIRNNVFDVFITQRNPMTPDCDQGVDLPFKFHVTGRPQ